ncbi:MAG: hypothetical protein M9892_07430 [Bacteroidetes bacterium]|nr:hypothetical protein [Bacteroidota bacterium]
MEKYPKQLINYLIGISFFLCLTLSSCTKNTEIFIKNSLGFMCESVFIAEIIYPNAQIDTIFNGNPDCDHMETFSLYFTPKRTKIKHNDSTVALKITVPSRGQSFEAKINPYKKIYVYFNYSFDEEVVSRKVVWDSIMKYSDTIYLDVQIQNY